jgi:MFS family permease
MSDKENSVVGGRHAKIALGLLVIVYIFNFVDRQIISILAEDIKADLDISNSDIGFLFGTAFGVFYSVVGIPMGKLADSWNRKNLISIGLSFWSLMTALSGTAKTFLSLSIYRFGVGIGESTATPSAYSLLSDYFSPKVRATVLSIYSSGLYIGAAIGLFLGGWILDTWNSAYPEWMEGFYGIYPGISQAPFGLKGWQAAFIGVGLPGILLSIITFTFIKEPIRGMSEGIVTEPSKEPFKDTFKEFLGLTPLSFIGRKDLVKTLLTNLLIASTIFLVCFLLYQLTEDFLQWVAWGIGAYLVCTWIQSLKKRDPVAFNLMFRSKAIVYAFISFPCIPFVGYAYSNFTPSFYQNYHGMTALEIGTLIGLVTAIGSFIGVIGGGYFGDKLKEKYVGGRLYVIFAGGIVVTVLGCLGMIYTESKNTSIVFNFIYHIGSSVYVGCAATTVTNLVLPRMRAMSGAFFILTLSMIGLALGPYTLGRIADSFEYQGYAPGDAMQTSMALILLILIIPSVTLFMAVKHLKEDEESVTQRAKALGENI